MYRQALRKHARWLMSSGLATIVLAGTIALADGGGTTTIHACVKKTQPNKGATRIIGANQACRASERSVHWNVQGRPGTDGTDGTSGQDGRDGDTLVGSACSLPDGTDGIIDLAVAADGAITFTCDVPAGDPVKPHLVVSLDADPRTSPGHWTVASGFIQHFNPLQVQAVDVAGARVTDFSGTVALSSSCPLATEGGASHAYASVDGGSFIFSIGLGDDVAFGAQRGVESDPSTPGVACTVTATDTADQATAGSQELRAAGEFCDGVDNNENGVVDLDGFPEKGEAAPDGGIYVCSQDGTRLTAA